MGLEVVAQMIGAIGAAAKSAADGLRDAAAAATEYAAASESTSGKNKAGGGGVGTSMSSSSLGDPRDASESAARMNAAIAAAGRGR